MAGPHPKSKEELCRVLRHGPTRLPRELKSKDYGKLLEAGWLKLLDGDEDEYELGPSCGLILSIVARREGLECAVIKPDGRIISRDDDPAVRFEAKRALFAPREPMANGRYTGITPKGFVNKLVEVVQECIKHRRSVADVGFSAVCIAWPGRIDRFARPAADGKPLGDVCSYEQKAYGGWTVGEDPVSLGELVEEGLVKAGLRGQPPVLVINDADAELLSLANIPLEERSPTEEEIKDGGPAARAQAIHERIRDAKVALSITVTGGVAGALLIDGSLVRGQRGFVGELGEVPIDITHPKLEKGVVAKRKKLATLQKMRGFPRWEFPHESTLDYWASARTIVDQLLLAEPMQSNFKRKKTYSEQLGITREHTNPELVTAILERSGRLIGLGIISSVLMLDPGVILVSSPLPSKPLANGIKELLNDEVGFANPDENIVFAVDGDPTRQLKGAARWAIQEIVDPALEQVCRGKNDGLKKLDLLELTPWPRT